MVRTMQQTQAVELNKVELAVIHAALASYAVKKHRKLESAACDQALTLAARIFEASK